MHVTVRLHEGGACLVCEHCGQECDVPPQLTPGAVFDAFAALHPPRAHDLAGCPDWKAAARSSP